MNRALAQVVALAVVVPLAVVVTTSPARAEEPYETALKQVVQETADWAETGLSRIGQLAQPLPLLGISPGSLVDADQLVNKVADALATHGLSSDNRDLGGGTRLTSNVSE
jgi:hypothetical protein